MLDRFVFVLLFLLTPTATSTGMLVLHNTRWPTVEIEVRTGSSSQCDLNPSVGIKMLANQRAWAIVTSEVICWRRRQVPGDVNSSWTTWQQIQLTTSLVRDVTL